MHLKWIFLGLAAILLLGSAPGLAGAMKGFAAGSNSRSSGQRSSVTKSKAAKKVSRKRARRRRVRGQMSPSSDRIREIQAALAQKGVYPGEPTGKWNAASIDAMRRFQAANGLNATGKLDAPSLQKLGLGSQVAGLAAPRPAVQPATANGQQQ